MLNTPMFGWDLLTALTNTKSYAFTAMVKFAGIFGVVLLVAGLIVLGFGLFKKSTTQQPVPYGVAAALIIVGGVMAVAGRAFYSDMAKGTARSINKMGGSGSKGAGGMEVGADNMMLLHNLALTLPF